ncbi:hypothetical protein HYH03_011576 [Edaphochlamys debaryana]|uniref:SET domain-containing protein n=1 Tax=Edaphochlamys debaryana TaxID=47281 RepID=A0A835XUF9_9CHLO|nr:hypothetical protein HYH03_011576 [Edaphochlamys debaryana]|eukprot:KAG2489945.1 hypothetical protein HYH03_011576 [Edaphochlamys debaryana]
MSSTPEKKQGSGGDGVGAQQQAGPKEPERGVRLGLLLFSAGIAALITALVVPLADPKSLELFAQHPLGAAVFNATDAATRAFARLLTGSGKARPPSIAEFYPLPLDPATAAALASAPEAESEIPELDWGHHDVWRLQQENVSAPFYTSADIDRLLHWCSESSSSGSGAGVSSQRRYERLARWVTAHGGDVSGLEPGVDEHGVRGLQATRDFAAGEYVLSVPLRLGLSIASFRGARLAAGPTNGWRSVEDGDLFLDALALAYEVAVHGDRSPWADYICLMPRTYGGLPVHASTPSDAALLQRLPGLRRLAAKRRAQLSLFGERLARGAVEALPGGRAAMSALSKAGGTNGTSAWFPLWHWAYAAAKTRAVTLSAGELRQGGGAAPGDEAGLPFRLPLSMLDWVQEFGVLLPILDLANHAFDAAGANAAYQLLATSDGKGLAATLMALRPIARGEAVVFDYVSAAEAEAGPACTDRWLIEYGFVPETEEAVRQCDTFEITPVSLAAAVKAVCGKVAPDADLIAGIERRLAAAAAQGLPPRLEVVVRTPLWDEQEAGTEFHVRQKWMVTKWIDVAVDEFFGKHGRYCDPNVMLQALLYARLEELKGLEEEARAGSDREDGRELRAGVAAVAAAAQKAVQRAIEEGKDVFPDRL